MHLEKLTTHDPTRIYTVPYCSKLPQTMVKRECLFYILYTLYTVYSTVRYRYSLLLHGSPSFPLVHTVLYCTSASVHSITDRGMDYSILEKITVLHGTVCIYTYCTVYRSIL